MENGTGYRMEHAMEHGNWNMQWNMENWNMQWKMEWDIEWNMQWNGTRFIFYKSQNSPFPAAVCVPIATEIWDRPMEHMLIIETDVSFLQKQQETTGVNIF